MIEASDVMFAVDSVPAVFAVTNDVFIVYTSNIFAILGLRALYSLLAAYIARFSHLRYGLAGVLAFVGVKMLIADWWHVPILLSLGIIALMLTAALVASAIWPGKPEPLPDGAVAVLPEEDRAAVAPGAVTAGAEGRPGTAEPPPR